MTASTIGALDHLSEQVDRDLAATVESALWEYDPLRTSNARIDVRATDGLIVLHGNVRGQAMRWMAGKLAAEVPGVTSVENRIVSDTDIEASVAMALAIEPSLALDTSRLLLKSLMGVVYLGGTVAGADLDTARASIGRATALARTVPGVVDVIGEMEPVLAAEADAESDSAAEPADGAGDAAGAAAMAERLKVWKERSAQA